MITPLVIPRSYGSRDKIGSKHHPDGEHRFLKCEVSRPLVRSSNYQGNESLNEQGSWQRLRLIAGDVKSNPVMIHEYEG